MEKEIEIIDIKENTRKMLRVLSYRIWGLLKLNKANKDYIKNLENQIEWQKEKIDSLSKFITN